MTSMIEAAVVTATRSGEEPSMIAGSVNIAMRTNEYARLASAPMPRQRDRARTPTASTTSSRSSGGPRSKSWKAYCSPSSACAVKDTMMRSPATTSGACEP